jgi:hypothetical protein
MSNPPVAVRRTSEAGTDAVRRRPAPARNPSGKENETMRVMVIVKGDPAELPGEAILEAMGKYNERLAAAGLLLSGEGLRHSSAGKRVRFDGDRKIVIDGPFAESKELIAGFWIWQVDSMEEAIDWVKQMPHPREMESEVEIRRVFEADDFGDALTPEMREREERLRAKQ